VLIEKFLQYCTLNSLSPHTIRSYQYSLTEFSQRQDCQGISGIKQTHVKAYIEQLQKEGKAPTTIQSRIAALSSFFDWAVNQEIINRNPASNIRLPKIPKRQPEYIPRLELMEMIEKVKGDDFVSLRNRAILEVGYSGLLRVSDLRNANREDLDFEACRLKVIGKGNKEEYVPLGEYAIDAIKNYLAQRDKERVGTKEPALFVSVYGERLSRIDAVVRDLLNMGPHAALRTSGATHIYLSGGDVRFIQQLLRHSDLSTTQRYMGFQDQHFRDQFNAHSPRARIKA